MEDFEFDSYTDFQMDNDYREEELDIVGRREADEDREVDYDDEYQAYDDDGYVDDQQDY